MDSKLVNKTTFFLKEAFVLVDWGNQEINVRNTISESDVLCDNYEPAWHRQELGQPEMQEVGMATWDVSWATEENKVCFPKEYRYYTVEM